MVRAGASTEDGKRLPLQGMRNLVPALAEVLGIREDGRGREAALIGTSCAGMTQARSRNVRGTPMTWLDYLSAWLLLGLVNCGIKLLKYHNDWQKDGNQVFFVAVLAGALVFGPIGLMLTLIRSRGNPFKTLPTDRE